MVVTEKDGWKWSFTDLPKNKDGKGIVYSVSELPVKEYSTTVKGYNIVNVYNPPNSPKTGDMEDYLRLSVLGILSLMGFGLTAVYWFRKTKRSK